MPTCTQCQQPFPLTVYVEGKARNLQRRKRCLACAPFGSETARSREVGTLRPCIICGREVGSRRRRCNSCTTKIRRLRMKLRALAYLGGKCSRCGWDKHLAGLQFHHQSPKGKDFSIGNVAHKGWAAIRAELDKCVILCACCHCIEHSDRYDNPVLLKEARSYGQVAQ